MTPTILPADQLSRALTLVTTEPQPAGGLPEGDRQLLEAVLGSACHGPVARDEYLAALARATGDRTRGGATGVPTPLAWDTLLQNGLPALSDLDLLSVAASPNTIRELNRRVGLALCDGSLTDVWRPHFEIPAAADPVLDQRVQANVEFLRRLHAEFGGRAEAERPSDASAHRRIPLTLDRPPLHMAAADESEVARFLAPDGSALEVYRSHRPGLSELCLVTPPPDGEVEVFVDGVPVPLVAPFDRNGLATAHTAGITPALLGHAQLELRFRPASDTSAGGSPPPPPREGRP